eukprot:scaffold195813_cov56-Attheya_sp.AAC.2
MYASYLVSGSDGFLRCQTETKYGNTSVCIILVELPLRNSRWKQISFPQHFSGTPTCQMAAMILVNALDQTTRDEIHDEFADDLSVALCSFLKDGYGSDDLC